MQRKRCFLGYVTLLLPRVYKDLNQAAMKDVADTNSVLILYVMSAFVTN